MAPYVPALVWLISALAFEFIARRRGATPTLPWRLAVVLFGPLAIPLAFLLRPDSDRE